jgi:hypothetical protein
MLTPLETAKVAMLFSKHSAGELALQVPVGFSRVRRSAVLVALMLALSLLAGYSIAQERRLGIHVHRQSSVGANDLGMFSAIRLWDSGTAWRDLEPFAGHSEYAPLAGWLRMAEAHRWGASLVLGSTPRWASSRPDERCSYGFGCAAAPQRLEDWRRYVRETVQAFAGRIECYEPWNEVSFPTDSSAGINGEGGAPGEFFSGTVAEMVALTRVAYEEIKRVDPPSCVLSPSFHSSGHWEKKLDAFLGQGGSKYIDKISFHFYFALDPETIVPEMRMVRRVMAKHGISIWNTEVGLQFKQLAQERGMKDAADLIYSTMLRATLINYSEGIERVYWYSLDNGNMGFGTGTSGSRFAKEALQAVAAELSGSLEVQCGPNKSLWTCRVRKQDGSTVTIVWQAGIDIPPTRWRAPRAASRWNHDGVETLRAGETVSLDWRPVVMKDRE